MKYSFGALAAAAITLSAASALAADLPVRAPAPAPIFAAAPFSWNGFYVGLHAGYGWTIDDVVGVHVTPPAGGIFDGNIGNVNPKGFLGGAQAGYNLQYGSIVYGIEGDFSFTGRSARAANTVALPLSGFDTARVKEEWFGSIRGRLGVAADRALFYVTGGLGFTNVKYSLSGGAGALGGVPFVSGSSNSTRMGWVGGAGVEYAFTNNMTARLEGLYYNLPKYRVSVVPVGGIGGFTQATQAHALVRLGINYKF